MALLPPGYLDAVVALETRQGEDDFSTVATGVIVGFDAGEVDVDGDQLFRIFLATNRHVMEGATEMWARFSKGTGSDRYRLTLVDGEAPRWKCHPQFDAAAIPLNTKLLDERGSLYAFIPEGRNTLNLEQMEEQGISVGDGVFVLGFPMGLSGAQKKRTIVRTGGIARLDAEVVEEVGGFLIDATIFPGNSGGPVFNIPAQAAITGTKAVPNCSMIGLVASYIPYEEVAISQQTGRQRIVFQENSGLASVVPFDALREVVQDFLDTPAIPGTGDQPVSDADAAEGPSKSQQAESDGSRAA